jgi:oxygen-independent coproporphyrinogen-3 oxidase
MHVAHPSTLHNAASLAGMSKAVLRKMDQRGPRYTSYPTADRFSSEFAVKDYLHAVSDRRSMGAWRALSLYLHIPFCDTICYYCACNKIVT